MRSQNFADGFLRLARKKRIPISRAGKALLTKNHVEMIGRLGAEGAVEQGGAFSAFALRDLFRREKKFLHGCESAFAGRQKADAQGTVGCGLDFCGVEVRHSRPDFLKHLQRHTSSFYAVNMGECTNYWLPFSRRRDEFR